MSLSQQNRPLSHLDDYLAKNSQLTPSKAALVCSDRTLSWAELESESEAFAKRLACALRPRTRNQQVVALFLPNGWQFVVAYLAIIKLGHMAAPIDISYKRIEVEAIVKQLEVSLLIGSEATEDSIKKWPAFASFKNISLSPEDKPYKPLRLTATKQVASLLFTSGTTGQPKTVPNTHHNQIWNIETCSKVWRWNSKDSLLISLRLSHMYGLVVGLTGCLYHGNTMYLQDWFNPKDTLKALSSGRISIFKHVPVAYQQILEYTKDHPSEVYDLSKVRLFTSGGGPLPPDIWHAFKSRYGIKIIETYGTSETGRIAGNLLNSPHSGSPGHLLPGVKAKISTESELLIKSGGVFPGYYKNPKATEAGFTADGWWKTGDIVEITKDRIVLKGRVQEKIRKAGYTISPRDVEWALLKNSKIKEAYVMGFQEIGVPSDKLIYFLAGNINDSELTEYCKQNLLFAWRPDRVIRLARLPRTPSGKIKIPELRKLATNES